MMENACLLHAGKIPTKPQPRLLAASGVDLLNRVAAGLEQLVGALTNESNTGDTNDNDQSDHDRVFDCRRARFVFEKTLDFLRDDIHGGEFGVSEEVYFLVLRGNWPTVPAFH